MKTFKEFMAKIKAEKSGLIHPVDNHVRNKPKLNPIEIPIEIHSEFKGNIGKHHLKADGKYSIDKK